MRRSVGRLLVRALRYEIVGEPAPGGTACVLLAAPHTSWLDFPLMLGIAWAEDLSPRWLGKQELFRAPFGGIMRRLSGIPVDREDPGSLVADMTADAELNARVVVASVALGVAAFADLGVGRKIFIHVNNSNPALRGRSTIKGILVFQTWVHRRASWGFKLG